MCTWLWLVGMHTDPPFYPIRTKRVPIDWAWAEVSADLIIIPRKWPRFWNNFIIGIWTWRPKVIFLPSCQKKQLSWTSQNSNFIAGILLGSTKYPHRFQKQPSSYWPCCTLKSGRGALETEADIALSKLASTCCGPASIVPAPFGLWADPCTASNGGLSLSGRREAWGQSCCCLRCQLLEHCVQKESILQQQQKKQKQKQKQKLSEAPRREKHSNTPQLSLLFWPLINRPRNTKSAIRKVFFCCVKQLFTLTLFSLTDHVDRSVYSGNFTTCTHHHPAWKHIQRSSP